MRRLQRTALAREMRLKIKEAEYLKENVTLKSHVRVLTDRVKELEAQLAKAKQLGFDPDEIEKEKPVLLVARSPETAQLLPIRALPL